LTHGEIHGLRKGYGDTLAVASKAEDRREDGPEVGHTTMTLFAIESGDVISSIPVEEAVVWEVVQALEYVGYDAKVVESANEAEGRYPMMAISIHELSFTNYTWLWPYVPTWGDITLGVTLHDTDGKIVFEDSYSAEGNSSDLNTQEGFEEATREAITEVLNQIVQAVSTAAFRVAFEAGQQDPALGSVAAPPPASQQPGQPDAQAVESDP
jgi:hypothetical protein